MPNTQRRRPTLPSAGRLKAWSDWYGACRQQCTNSRQPAFPTATADPSRVPQCGTARDNKPRRFLQLRTLVGLATDGDGLLDGGGALELVPGERSAFDSALERLEQ